MNKILEEERREDEIRTVVMPSNGKVYAVDTADTWDAGPESMVFPYNLRMHSFKSKELYARRYNSMPDAYKGHTEICDNLDKYIIGHKRQG